jgi:hypothetical protein
VDRGSIFIAHLMIDILIKPQLFGLPLFYRPSRCMPIFSEHPGLPEDKEVNCNWGIVGRKGFCSSAWTCETLLVKLLYLNPLLIAGLIAVSSLFIRNFVLSDFQDVHMLFHKVTPGLGFLNEHRIIRPQSRMPHARDAEGNTTYAIILRRVPPGQSREADRKLAIIPRYTKKRDERSRTFGWNESALSLL